MGALEEYARRSGVGRGGASKAPSKTSVSQRNALFRGMSRALGEAREILGNLPRMGGAVVSEAADIAELIPQMRAVVAPVRQLGDVLKGQPYIPEGKVARQSAKAFRNIGSGRQGVVDVLDLPGIRHVPGTFVARELTRPGGGAHALGERPLSTALDVLPYVSKLSRVATQGSRLAAQAEQSARAAGKLAKAETIAKRGLEPRQVVMQAARAAERSVATKYPRARHFLPSQVLESWGVGGERLRNFTSTISVAQRRFGKDASRNIPEFFRKGKEFGLDGDAVVNLTRRMEAGAPGWRDALTPEEAGFVRWAQSASDRFRQIGVDRGDLFTWRGETYAKGDSPHLYRAVQRVESAKRGLGHAARGRGRRTPGVWAGKTIGQWEAEIVTRADRASRLSAKTPSARWREALQPHIAEAVKKASRGASTDLDWETIVRFIDSGDFTGAGTLPRAQVQQIARGIGETWQKLRAAGYDPQFVHHVRESQLRGLQHPRLVPGVIRRPSDVKARSLIDMEPHVPDVTVALGHQELELLQRLHGERLIDDWVRRGFLKNHDEVINEVNVQADRIARVTGKDVNAVRSSILKRDWAVFDPDSVFPVAGGRPQLQAGQYYLPRNLARSLEMMTKQMSPAGWARVARIPGNLFRLSILTLNPFYYIENILSGIVMVSMADKASSLRFLGAARKMIRDGTLPDELSVGVSHMSPAELDLARLNDQVGRQIGDILNGKGTLVGRGGKRLASGLLAGERGAQRFSGYIDDMYKAATYLGASKRARKFGMSEEAAIAAGVDAAHRVLVNMDRLTPFERTVVRNVFPFYSWSQHILKYTFGLPFDHPWRVAIISSLSRQLEEDWPDGLPDRFRNQFFFGGRGYRTTGAFPMQAVPGYFALAGILSRLNPQTQVGAEYLGLDPMTWTPDRYYAAERPTRWDEMLQQEVPTRPSLARLAATGYTPQVENLLEVLAPSQDMERLRASNPDAYRARLLRNFGIPLPQTVDVAAELEKAAGRRERYEEGAAKRAEGLEPVPVTIYRKPSTSPSPSKSSGGGMTLEDYARRR